MSDVDKAHNTALLELERDAPLLANALTMHVSTRGLPLSIKAMPYLVEPLRDFLNVDDASVMKAVQTGWTEMGLQLLFRRAGWDGRTCVYVLPTADIRNDFVQRRVDAVLTVVPEYRARLPWGMVDHLGKPQRADQVKRDKAAENLRLKHFGAGTMMFIGSNQRHNFVEWSADLSIVDELDHCDKDNLQLLPDRLKASPYKQSFRFGNPTTANGEIAIAYAQGDRRQWHMKCPGCSHWQVLDWFQHIVEQDDVGGWVCRDKEGAKAVLRGDAGADIRPVCARCHKPFQRPPLGAWVAESPGVPKRSYRVSRLEVLTDRLWTLFLEWLEAQGKTGKLERFFNSLLGLPYERSGSGLTDAVLQACATGAPLDVAGGPAYHKATVVAGVDVGALLNVQVDVIEQLALDPVTEAEDLAKRLLGDDPDAREAQALQRPSRRRTVWAGTVKDFEQLDTIIHRYNVQVLTVDAMPETRKATELRDRHRGKDCAVWLCRFHPGNRVGAEEYATRLDHETRVVLVDRTQLLDATLDELTAGRRVLPTDYETIPDYVSQMTAPKRVLSEKGDRFVWNEGAKADHYRFADSYSRVAMDVLNRGGSFDLV